MKKCYLLLFILIVFTAQSPAQTAASADTLHDAFLTRPLSIVKEEPRWNTASTDLFTSWITSGLYGFYGPQPQIMLNGIPLNTNFFGWQNLNALPLFVLNINKAVSRFSPGVYNQTLAGTGVINFKTEPLKEGFTARAFYFTGNETKDPGPWAYDSLKISPNIDRWGPDKGMLLGYKAKKWYLKGMYIERFHKPRDLAQNIRLHFTNSFLGTNKRYVNHPIFIESQSGLLKAGFSSTHFSVSSRFILSKNNDYLFLQPFAREVPVQMKYRQWAVQARYCYGPWYVKTRYVSDYKTLDKRVALHTYIFDWKQLNNAIALSGGYRSENFLISPGLIYKQLDTHAPGLHNANDNIFTLFFKSKLAVHDNIAFYLNSYVDYHKNTGGKSVSVKLGGAFQLSSHYTVKPELFYTESNPIRQHSFAYWVNRGYTFADRLGVSFYYPRSVLENEALSLKLTNQFSFGDFNVTVAPQYIKNYRLNIPWQMADYFRVTHTMPGRFTVSQHAGERFKLLAILNHPFSSLLQQSLTIYLQQTISGSDRYRNYFKQIADTKIKYQLDIAPVRGLTISLNGVYRSSTKWLEFAAVDGKEYSLPAGIPIDFTRTFNITTPSFVNLGLSVSKWFLDQHINLKVGIQNILDREVRYHPIGASLYPAVNFKVSVRI